ncbi:MAG: hypothetical protein LKI24_16240 [Acidipropionibacterium sp.]|jgi:hypothetical protein|nr:hypothetical protein [Acidipropionibacterium sp.]
MKVHLMSPVRDFDPERLPDPLPPQTADLVQDLELDVLFDAMAGGDAFIRKVVRAAILDPPDDPEDARHRLEVLSYLAERPEVARALYEIAGRALARPRSLWLVSNGRPEASLRRSTVLLGQMCDALDELRRLVETGFGGLGSAGLRDLAETVRTQLPEEYMAELRAVLEVLSRRDGVLMAAGLGDDGTVAGMAPRVIGQVGRFGQPAAPRRDRRKDLYLDPARSRRGRRPGRPGTVRPGPVAHRAGRRTGHQPCSGILHRAAPGVRVLPRLPHSARPARGPALGGLSAPARPGSRCLRGPWALRPGTGAAHRCADRRQ